MTGKLSLDFTLTDRILIAAGGLCGAAGVGLSAAAAHAGGAYSGTVASILLAHAPVLLVVGLVNRFAGSKTMRLGAYGMLLGVLLFSADLLVRDFIGHRLFAMAAPAGGILMIAGWLVLAASAFIGSPRR